MDIMNGFVMVNNVRRNNSCFVFGIYKKSKKIPTLVKIILVNLNI